MDIMIQELSKLQQYNALIVDGPSYFQLLHMRSWNSSHTIVYQAHAVSINQHRSIMIRHQIYQIKKIKKLENVNWQLCTSFPWLILQLIGLFSEHPNTLAMLDSHIPYMHGTNPLDSSSLGPINSTNMHHKMASVKMQISLNMKLAKIINSIIITTTTHMPWLIIWCIQYVLSQSN